MKRSGPGEGQGAQPDEEMGDYDSGPFCRHGNDQWYCDEKCACGHECPKHIGNGRENCRAAGCECEEFREPPAAGEP